MWYAYLCGSTLVVCYSTFVVKSLVSCSVLFYPSLFSFVLPLLFVVQSCSTFVVQSCSTLVVSLVLFAMLYTCCKLFSLYCCSILLLACDVVCYVAGTLREGEEDTDTDSLQQRLSRAFDVLQDDLKRSSFQKVRKFSCNSVEPQSKIVEG